MGLSRNIARVIVSDTGEISASNLGAVPPTPEVLTPSNTSPANEATDEPETPTLTASTFYSLYGFTHSKSQWQVSTVSDFASTVVSTGDVDDLTSYTVAGGVLSANTTYYWRVRYKDSNGSYSAYSTATSFTTAALFTIAAEILVVAGGGGGGSGTGGGGGGGEVLYGAAIDLTPNQTYTVTVGGGGPGSPYNGGSGSSDKGNNSVFDTATAIGGGGGGYHDEGTRSANGGDGGSGGGANSASSAVGGSAVGTIVTGYTTYGNDGGDNAGGTASAAGGGGAGQVGGNAGVNGNVGGLGGNGQDLSAQFGTGVGESGVFAGGGGGGSQSNVGGGPAAGGTGGGGTAQATSDTGEAGTPNTGGGGAGGGWSNNYAAGGGGGSGVVIIKYPDSITISNPGGGLTYSTSTAGGFSVTTFIVGTGNVSWS